jgi:hypothetical protein
MKIKPKRYLRVCRKPHASNNFKGSTEVVEINNNERPMMKLGYKEFVEDTGQLLRYASWKRNKKKCVLHAVREIGDKDEE